MEALPAPARCVLLVTDEHFEPVQLSLGSLLDRYRSVTGFKGSIWIEAHLVLKPRPIEVRTAMVTRMARKIADLVVWPAHLAEVGEGIRGFLEREQGREAGSLSYGVVTLVSPPFAPRPIYKSDLYCMVPE